MSGGNRGSDPGSRGGPERTAKVGCWNGWGVSIIQGHGREHFVPAGSIALGLADNVCRAQLTF